MGLSGASLLAIHTGRRPAGRERADPDPEPWASLAGGRGSGRSETREVMRQGSFPVQVLSRRPARGKGWADLGPSSRHWALMQEEPGWSDFTAVYELVLSVSGLLSAGDPGCSPELLPSV